MNIGVNSRIYQNRDTGIPLYVKYLYSELQKVDKENKYFFFQTDAKKKIGKTILLKHLNNSIGAVFFDLFFVFFLAYANKISVFHGTSNLLPFIKFGRINYIVTIHDLSFLIFPEYHSSIFNYYYKFAVRRSLKNASLIIAVSDSTKRDIINFFGIDEEKIRVVHSGISDVYRRQKKMKRIIKDKYIFSITTHPKRKNINSVLNVLATNKNLKGYRCVIAGSINNGHLISLKKIVAQLGLGNRVIILGHVSDDDMVSLYQHAEFFIYPSFYEGFGFPVLEAMISKCPVIASNSSSITEITPSNDWLANPYSVEEISEKVDKLLDLSTSDRYSMISDNYKFARKFSWNSTARQMKKVFDEVSQA